MSLTMRGGRAPLREPFSGEEAGRAPGARAREENEAMTNIDQTKPTINRQRTPSERTANSRRR
jgi:hypothetical protein